MYTHVCKMYIHVYMEPKNRSYMPNKSDKITLIVGVATDYYTFIHSPCCFPVANEACFWYLQLSHVGALLYIQVS